MSRTQTSTSEKRLSIQARGDSGYPRAPLALSGALAPETHVRVNPVLGERFDSLRLKEDIWDQPEPTRSSLLRDLGILIAQRGVVVFKRQDSFPPALLGELVHRLGQLTGKPATSKLHIHPLNGDFNEDGSRKAGAGGEKITTERDAQGRQISAMDERSDFGSQGMHTDISFEPVPADFTALRMDVLPECGGDTLFYSSYEAYDRLSPAMQAMLAGTTATHDAEYFQRQADRYGFKLRTQERGCPEDVGGDLRAVHPVVRTHPVTGWRSLFVNPTFTKRINELSLDESDIILCHLHALHTQNHQLQLRHSWDRNDVVIWDNRCVQHAATFDLDAGAKRSGDRAVGLAERPYFDPRSLSRRTALAAQ